MNARVAEWQTRTTQNRVRKLMWVQLPPWAQKNDAFYGRRFCFIFVRKFSSVSVFFSEFLVFH